MERNLDNKTQTTQDTPNSQLCRFGSQKRAKGENIFETKQQRQAKRWEFDRKKWTKNILLNKGNTHYKQIITKESKK